MAEVTRVEIFPLKKQIGKIKAFGKVTLIGKIVIDGVKVISGTKGLFVGMPSVKSKEGTFSDVVIINDKDLKNEIQKKVLEAYNGNGDTEIEDTDAEDDFPFN